jgi:hypothetical protein
VYCLAEAGVSSGPIHSGRPAEAATRASRGVAINAAPAKLKTPAGGGRGFRVDEQGEKFDRPENI